MSPGKEEGLPYVMGRLPNNPVVHPETRNVFPSIAVQPEGEGVIPIHVQVMALHVLQS